MTAYEAYTTGEFVSCSQATTGYICVISVLTNKGLKGSFTINTDLELLNNEELA